MPDAIDELSEQLYMGGLITDSDLIMSYRSDQARWVDAGYPAAVALPRHVKDVRTTLVWATKHAVPIVARGAGSGLSGGASAIDGCVVLSLERLNGAVQIDPENQTALVEAGVVNAEVSKMGLRFGLWYPPDPASFEFSTIGGNVATNAGGLCCVKYGVTRDYVLALEVVLADGTLVWTGRRTAKGVAGYDLTSLLVGSEGTLGVVTKALLRLRRRPRPGPICLSVFPTLGSAGRAVAGMWPVEPSLLEIMDRRSIQAVEEWKGLGLDTDAEAVVLAQVEERDRDEVSVLEKASESAGASYVAVSTDTFEAEELLNVRRLVYPALERRGPTLLDDVAVPRSELTRFMGRVSGISDRLKVEIATFGHAGDGNLHPTILFDDSAEGRATAALAFNDVVEAAIELGGTCTGEHGVGVLKLPFLALEQGHESLGIQAALKRTLDPAGILNPGRGIP